MAQSEPINFYGQQEEMDYNTQEENANHEGPDSEETGQYEVAE